MENWRSVWRDGFIPVLTTVGLEALRGALKNDDPRLTQGSTTTPPPLMSVQDWPVEAACAAHTTPASVIPAYLIFVMDRSDSMKMYDKFPACSAALESFFSDPSTTGTSTPPEIAI